MHNKNQPMFTAPLQKPVMLIHKQNQNPLHNEQIGVVIS